MRILKNYSNFPSSLTGLNILSAVRTPTGLLNGVLSEFSAPQLGAFAIREALQRAAVPPADLENLFLECVSHDECHEEVIKRTGLSKFTKVAVFPTGSMKSLSEAVKFLVRNNGKVCVAGKMESVTRSFDRRSYLNFIKFAQEEEGKLIRSNLVNREDRKKFEEQNYNNFVQAAKSGAFSDEIVKIDFWKKGQQILVEQDELSSESNLVEPIYLKSIHANDHPFKSVKMTAASPQLNLRDLASTHGDGATAIILSTVDYSKENKLVPLAKVVSYAEGFIDSDDLTSAQVLAIEKALDGAKCKCDDMARWEMLSVINDTIIKCRNYMNIKSSQVNKDGSILSLGYPTGMSGVRAICHLVHSLSAGESGCVTCCDFKTASAVIVKKLGVRKSSKPQLTLYTKHSCALCDELKNQLKIFKERCSVVEVDIEGREGEKYKELYQYEIPVLFLDGIFLCKHRLDVEDFNRRLLAAEGAA